MGHISFLELFFFLVKSSIVSIARQKHPTFFFFERRINIIFYTLVQTPERNEHRSRRLLHCSINY